MENNKTRIRGIVKVLVLLIFLFQVRSAMAVELLVNAKSHWQDTWDMNKVASLSKEEKQTYDARAQIGDIIVVRPDGWQWGKEEGLPNYIVVKIPSISFEVAQKYEDVLKDETGKILKKRKYRIPQIVVNGWKLAGKSVTTIDLAEKAIFISTLIEKTQ